METALCCFLLKDGQVLYNSRGTTKGNIHSQRSGDATVLC